MIAAATATNTNGQFRACQRHRRRRQRPNRSPAIRPWRGAARAKNNAAWCGRGGKRRVESGFHVGCERGVYCSNVKVWRLPAVGLSPFASGFLPLTSATMSKRAQFAVGIDLGTTNSVVAFTRLEDGSASVLSPIELLPIPQVVAPSTVENRPALPSFLYLAPSQRRRRRLPPAVGQLARLRRG